MYTSKKGLHYEIWKKNDDLLFMKNKRCIYRWEAIQSNSQNTENKVGIDLVFL